MREEAVVGGCLGRHEGPRGRSGGWGREEGRLQDWAQIARQAIGGKGGEAVNADKRNLQTHDCADCSAPHMFTLTHSAL